MSYRNLAILLDNFGSPSGIKNANIELLHKTGLDPVVLSKLTSANFSTESTTATHELLLKENIQLISILDTEYPDLLKEIPKAPLLLYVRGNVEALNNLSLAVVGTRKISTYAQSIMPELLRPVAQESITIVSGLAFGVDSLAHNIALENNTPTIAVLAGGIDDATIYPRENLQLAHEIIKRGGAVISEYPPKTPPVRYNFPARNRIISGLAPATLVIECPMRSGALITASYALDQNRDVLAVPGSVASNNSEGTNELIKNGAGVILSGEDLLEYFELSPNKPIKQPAILTHPLLEHLHEEGKTLDELIDLSGMTASEVASIVTSLELEGKISQVNNKTYILIK